MINTIDDLRNEVANNTSPIKAIRLKCLDCSVFSYSEVASCEITDCPLHPFRMGKNPFRKVRHLSEEEKKIISDRLHRR